MSAAALSVDPADPPSDVLVKCCREKRWQAVILHVRAHPSDVKAATVAAAAAGDSADLLPLHLACLGGALIQVVKALLAANMIALQTKAGPLDRLPLHFLIAETAPAPSKNVVAAVVIAHPGACRIPDRGGNLPIHLACRAARASDAIFTSILSAYPEGAYARNLSGMYPLHLAASNGDSNTKKIALAALDRGTLYASISKMTSIRLSAEHESRIKTIEERHADGLAKMEARGKDEQAKLKDQIDGLAAQLKIEREVNSALREKSKVADVRCEEELALAVQGERSTASDVERRLRSELAEVRGRGRAHPRPLSLSIVFRPSRSKRNISSRRF